MSTVLFDTPGPRARARHRLYTLVSVLVLGGATAWALWVLWSKDQITPEKWEAFLEPTIVEALFEGLLETLTVAAVAIALAIAFGALFAVARLSDHAFLRWPAVVIVEFFRAVPLLLLIFFLFLSPVGQAFGSFWSLVIGLVLYNGSVLAEIFRAGLLSVPRGQREAGFSLGLRKSQVLRLVLAPQAVKSMLPAIISQCVVALKDTALGYVIGEAGIVDVGKQIYISPQYDNPLVVGLVLAAVFIVINYSLSRLAIAVEARMRRQGKQVVHSSAEDTASTSSSLL